MKSLAKKSDLEKIIHRLGTKKAIKLRDEIRADKTKKDEERRTSVEEQLQTLLNVIEGQHDAINKFRDCIDTPIQRDKLTELMEYNIGARRLVREFLQEVIGRKGE